MIPYGHQTITDEDIAAVVEVLHSDLITQGPVVTRFEVALAEYTHAGYAVAVSSGTAALHLACLALGLGPGDVLWTSPITFVASANCARYCGADVDFVDIDPISLNISVSSLRDKLEQAEKDGCLPKIIVPVHFGGLPCDMEAIAALADKYGFLVIEDACHALGAEYHGEPIGNCKYADAVVFSFHPVKAITTGEGGMVVTNDAALAEHIASLHTHGIQREHEAERPWFYQQHELGFNYRMSDMQAALGLSQLQRLPASISRRRQLAEQYDESLKGLSLITQARQEPSESAWHLYVVQLSEQASCSRLQLYRQMIEAGIGVNVHYIPVHTQPYYQSLGFRSGQFPRAEHYYERCLTLPLYPAMSDNEQEHVVSVLRQALEPVE
jgi:UDP-4-amino-4,6-dideoxy-N-acetyl-beta-L-altrosamine transaminase